MSERVGPGARPDGARPLDLEPSHKPLSADVRRLGALLGALLREQGPEWLFEAVERSRRAAIRRRAGDGGAEDELRELLGGLAPARALEIARAFSAWFDLVNLAERVHRLRRLDAHRAREGQEPDGLSATLASLRARGVEPERLRALLAELVVEPVLTAHPTEAVRRTLLTKELRMAAALLARREDAAHPAAEHARALRAVGEELTSSWQTEQHRAVRPSVADEREQALFFLVSTLWAAVPALHGELEQALEASFGERSRAWAELPRLAFASWIGGDMDGNPAVGADTIRASLARHAQLVLELYIEEVRELFRRLSQSRSRVGVGAELLARIEVSVAELPEVDAAIPERYADMPYRRGLWFMSARLERARDGVAGGYAHPDDFAADLRLVAASLRANRGQHAGLERVLDLERRVRVFGFHLATLDVRQDAWVHRRAVGELLGDGTFGERTPEERTRLVTAAWTAERAPEVTPRGDDLVRSLQVMLAIGEVRARYGPRAIGLYVISMARGPDDALAVLLLARAGGLEHEGAIPLDVAPLFETVDDLESAAETMRALFAQPSYREHLRRRGDVQWVMLGYSDSSKTSGLVASRVALQSAQRELLGEARAAGVALRFFHGRGGSASRGGSRPRRAILGTPAGSLAGHLRVTEQGEIIRAKFGLEPIARRTLSVLFGAALERGARDAAGEPDVTSPLLGELASAGRTAYRDLLERDPDFLEYFRRATPIDVIERLGLGSRPSRRREMRGVEDLRAIPWVFSWTQTRLLLPGWYGTGLALERVAGAHGVQPLRALARDSAFFATLLSDVGMVLAKAEPGIAGRYAELAGEVGERMFPRLLEEFERTKRWICEVQEVDGLLEREPRLAATIRLRNPYIDPMSFLQVDLLARWRAKDRDDPELLAALFATVHGLARGMQNTG